MRNLFRKTITLLVSAVFFLSCNKVEVGSGLLGTWKLKEVLNDPGNGSGRFRSIKSSKIITFNSDGTVSSNGEICNNSVESNSSSAGTYSLPDSTISSPNCANTFVKIHFKKDRGSLIIYYPCFEGCVARYLRK